MCFLSLVKLNLKEDVVSLTDFARNTRQHAEDLTRGGRARILTQNGKASVVVLSISAFEKMAHEAEEYRLDSMLRQAVEDYAGGNRGTDAKSAFNRIRKRAQKRRTQA